MAKKPRYTTAERRNIRTPLSAKKRHLFFLELARRYATKSLLRNRHGCMIVYNGRPISFGWNHVPFDGMKHTDSIHAEIDALRRLEKRWLPLLPKCELYVCRVYVDDDRLFKMSLPCDHCCGIIQSYGIRRVYYTMGDSISESPVQAPNCSPRVSSFCNSCSSEIN